MEGNGYVHEGASHCVAGLEGGRSWFKQWLSRAGINVQLNIYISHTCALIVVSQSEAIIADAAFVGIFRITRFTVANLARCTSTTYRVVRKSDTQF